MEIDKEGRDNLIQLIMDNSVSIEDEDYEEEIEVDVESDEIFKFDEEDGKKKKKVVRKKVDNLIVIILNYINKYKENEEEIGEIFDIFLKGKNNFKNSFFKNNFEYKIKKYSIYLFLYNKFES
jgi:hypothetical protein